MKRITLFLTALALTFNVFSQGIEFEHGTFAEALAKAKAQDKKLFVDFYTVWCGPCKKMTKEIFTQKEVGDYFKKNFIALKIDAEKGEGIEISKKWEVKGFPTMIFFNPDGTEAKRLVGATPDAQFFLDYCQQVQGEKEDFMTMYERYKTGERNLDFVRDLILNGSVHASTLPREEQMPWFEKFRDMAYWWFAAKRPSETVNKEDFRLVSRYKDGPNNGDPYVEYVYNNYEKYKEVVHLADLAMFIYRTNNQSIHESYRTGNLKWKEYLAAIHGRLAQVYADDPEGNADDTYKIMKYVAEGGYALSQKNYDGYMDWSDKYREYETSKGEAKSYHYSNVPSNLYYNGKDELSKGQIERVQKLIEEGLAKFPEDLTLIQSKGDYLALTGKKAKAKECYEKVLELSKGQRAEKYYKEQITKKIDELN